MKNSPDLAQILAQYLAQKISPWQFKIIQDWAIIAGNLSEYARVEKVTNDTLFLGVYDTAWMQELHLLSNMILQKVNRHLGNTYIKQIRLKYVQRHRFQPPRATNSQAIPESMLSKAELKALLNVKDLELRKSIEQFRHRCHE